MKTARICWLAVVGVLGIDFCLQADEPAKVTEAVNVVEHGSGASRAAASIGTRVHDGEYLETGVRSRAEMLLPNATVTRLGSNTIFNYSVETNTVDLQAGTILFCKPKDAGAMTIKTAAVTAGITGTTGFVSVTGQGRQKTYIFGIVEGHASATANGSRFSVGSGDILEFKPGLKPLIFAYDLPRFVKSSPLLTKFKSTLPNENAIEAAIDNYEDEVKRGFIQPPSHVVDYSGEIPMVSTPAFDSALNAQGQPKGAAPSAPPPSSPSSFGQ